MTDVTDRAVIEPAAYQYSDGKKDDANDDCRHINAHHFTTEI